MGRTCCSTVDRSRAPGRRALAAALPGAGARPTLRRSPIRARSAGDVEVHDATRSKEGSPISSAKTIPANVSPEAAALLERAYALGSQEQSQSLYRDWAETYDETMLKGLNYRSPATVAALLDQHLQDRAAPVLDVGCGTGLGGQSLTQRGFTTIDGLDLSPDMMRVAQRRGVYRALITADLHQPLPMPDSSYGGAIGAGIFTHGHVDARCLDELFRVLRPGAPFAFTVKLEVWESLGFKDKLQGLMECGGITERAFTHDRHYDNSAQPDGVFCVYQRT